MCLAGQLAAGAGCKLFIGFPNNTLIFTLLRPECFFIDAISCTNLQMILLEVPFSTPKELLYVVGNWQ